MSVRWYKQKNDYKQWKEGNIKYNCSIVNFFEQYGIEDFKCGELRTYEVKNRRQQSQYEQELIDKIDCVKKLNHLIYKNKNFIIIVIDVIIELLIHMN